MEILPHLEDRSRVWVYASNRAFSEEEIAQLTAKGAEFVDGWQVHGKDLHAGFSVLYNQFLVFAVDEQVAGASGCSIDSSVKFVRDAEAAFGVELLNKLNIAYHGANNTIAVLPMAEFQDEITAGNITPNTIVFNNLVENLGQLRSQWEIPAQNSWHNQLF